MLAEYSLSFMKYNFSFCFVVMPSIDGKHHKTFPSASNKISFKHDKARGRFVEANKNIRTGETIVVEQPYVACLLPEMFGTNCHHCFER